MSAASKAFSKFAVFLATALSFSSFLPVASAFELSDIIKVGSSSSELDARATPKSGNNKNAYLDEFASPFSGYFFTASNTGERGAYNGLISIARDVKNLFMAIAIIYLVISVLRLLFSKGGEDDAKKWKSSIFGTTIGIVVMQSAFVFVTTLYDKNITGRTADVFLDRIVYPFVTLMELLASFAFLFIAFLAFFKLVTAGGDDDKAKQAKRSIATGIAGFMLIKLPKAIVTSIYGSVKCENTLIFGVCKLEDPNLSGAVTVMTKVVNYINGFLGIVTVLLIIYAGWLVLTSGGDDEKLKKAKGTIKYIFVGLFLIVASYSLFNFFLLKS